jgi:hypothetical protein
MKKFITVVIVCILVCSCSSGNNAQSGAWLLKQAKAEISLPSHINFSQINYSSYWGGFGDSVATIRLKVVPKDVSQYLAHCEHTAKIHPVHSDNIPSLPKGIIIKQDTKVYTTTPAQSVDYFIFFPSEDIILIHRIKG